MFSRGIGMSVHYVPLHLHPYWRDTYNLAPEMFPVSQKTYETTATLPLYTRMTDEDVDRVITRSSWHLELIMAKRLFDFFASAFGLALLFPLLALVAILIKLDSRGGVFFPAGTGWIERADISHP